MITEPVAAITNPDQSSSYNQVQYSTVREANKRLRFFSMVTRMPLVRENPLATSSREPIWYNISLLT
jgi:hypothetical protein